MFFRRRGKAVNIVTMCCNAHKAERHERKLILPIVSVQNWLKKHGTEALEKNGFFGFVVEGRFLTQQMSRKIDVCKVVTWHMRIFGLRDFVAETCCVKNCVTLIVVTNCNFR